MRYSFPFIIGGKDAKINNIRHLETVDFYNITTWKKEVAA